MVVHLLIKFSHYVDQMGAFGFVTRYVYEEVVAFLKPKMYKSCQSIYYKVAIPIPNPSFDGCIWGCVPPILVTTRI